MAFDMDDINREYIEATKETLRELGFPDIEVRWHGSKIELYHKDEGRLQDAFKALKDSGHAYD